jgi:hypothetical protein
VEVLARGVLLRRNGYAVGGCVVAAAIAFVVAGHLRGFSVVIADFITLFAASSAVLIAVRNGFPWRTPTVVRVAPSGLSFDGGAVTPMHEVLEARRVPRGRGAAIVELTLAPRRRVVLLLAKTDAGALLEALGARRARFTLASSFWKRFLVSYLLFVVMAAPGLLSAGANVLHEGLALILLGLTPGAAILAWVAGLVRGRLVVGADGFTVTWLWRERFVPFSSVTSVLARSRLSGNLDTRVELASGETLHLRAVEAPNSNDERTAEGKALHDTLSSARARAAEPAVDVTAALRRDARTARAWLDGIDEMLRGGYRTAAVPVDTLAAVVADPRAPREARAGAAAALVRVGGDEPRNRVRVAAEGCAESDLRDVLRALAEAEDDESMESALGSLEG